MGGEKKPFCVKGGECIGNVPTIDYLVKDKEPNQIILYDGCRWCKDNYCDEYSVIEFDAGLAGNEVWLHMGVVNPHHIGGWKLKLLVRNLNVTMQTLRVKIFERKSGESFYYTRLDQNITVSVGTDYLPYESNLFNVVNKGWMIRGVIICQENLVSVVRIGNIVLEKIG